MRTRRFTAFTASLTLATILASAGCSDDSSTGRQADPSADPTAGPSDAPSSTGDSGGNTGGNGSGGVVGTPIGLVQFDGCDALLDYVKSEALERVGPYGLNGGPPVVYMEDDMMAATTVAASADGATESAGADSASGSRDEGLTSDTGTNVQEAGVDEPDIIKTDGKRIVTLSEGESGSVLTVVNIADRAPQVVGTLKIDGYGSDMVLAGDRVLVFTSGGTEFFGPVGSGDAEESFVTEGPLPEWAARTVIVEVSIAAEPTIVNSIAIEGGYLSARSVGNRLRVAVSSPPVSLPWVVPQTPAGEDRAEASNRQIIEESTLDDWLPNISVGGAAPTQLLNCDSVRHPATFAGFDTISVIDIDLDSGLAAPTDATGVMAAGQTVYSSLDRFYIASTDWNWNQFPIEPLDGATATTGPAFQDATTGLHAFSISDTEPTTYIGSGEVPGSLLNEFSMDSFDGNLRVFTTSTTEGGTTETFLRILAESGDRLTEIGSVGGLGKGEALYSARLFDDVGFAVTFEQIDPLYVLDLADPTNPKVSGELKIPGVSTYLHPIGDGRLLGIGAAATEDGARTGLKVSLFDVSNPANPTEITNWTLEGAGSESEYDSHAFQYTDGLLVLPIVQQEWTGGDVSAPEAVVLRIDDAITEVGRIQISVDEETPTSDCRPVDSAGLSTRGAEFATGVEHIQVCDRDAKGGWGSSYCDRWNYSDLASIYPERSEFESDAANIGLTEQNVLEVCYPGEGYWRNQVRRILSLNDTFYLLTNTELQANDRTSLAEIGSIKVS